MHAVILEVDTSGAEREAALKRLREEIIPTIKQAPGFRSGTWTGGPSAEDRRGLALVVFDTEENAQAAANRLSVGANPQPGVTVQRSEVREVVATA